MICQPLFIAWRCLWRWCLPFSRCVVEFCVCYFAALPPSLHSHNSPMSPPPPPQGELADTYIFYANLGMSSPSPHLRAAGVSILAVLVHPAPARVITLLPRLIELRTESWWQVALFSVQVACGLLVQLAAVHDGGEEAEAGPWSPSVAGALSILQEVLASGRGAPSPLVLQSFVAHGARLAVHYEAVRPLLVDALLALPQGAREGALCVTPSGDFLAPRTEALPLLGPSGQEILVTSVGDVLPYSPIVSQVVSSVAVDALSYLEVGHFQLLLACARSALGAESARGAPAAEGEGGKTSSRQPLQLPAEFAVLACQAPGLRDYVLVGICDPGCSAAALALLRLLILFLPSGGGGGLDLLSANTMQGSVYLLHCPHTGEPNPSLKAAFADFLRDIAGTSEEHSAAVQAFLVEWAGRYPQAMVESPMRGVLESISGGGGAE